MVMGVAGAAGVVVGQRIERANGLWNGRPCIPATAMPSTFPTTSCPACPIAVDRGKCGISAYGIFADSANSSANGPSPEPSTNAIFGRSAVRDKINCAAASARSYSPASGEAVTAVFLAAALRGARLGFVLSGSGVT